MNIKVKQLRIFLLILIILSIKDVCLAQVFEGVVKDEYGKNIEFASIFIPELSQGFSTNEDGQFSFKIAKGKYTFEFRHLSYQTEILTIDIPQPQPLTVTLKPKIYELSEAVVKQNAEDRAYAMMRQVIARAPYHKNQVAEYKSEAYIRGSFKIDKISDVMKKLNRKTLKENDIEEGSAYIQESINEVTYKNGKIDQRITAIKDNFPEFAQVDISAAWMFNIYDMENQMFVTPLSPKAFTYYKFEYKGYFVENDKTVNKIFINPRRNDNRLISGYIYVFENTWDVHSYELSGKQQMIEYGLKQIFGEAAPNVMLPIRNQITANFSIFGNKGEINSVSSIKYSDIKVNSQSLESRLAQTASSKKQAERQQKIQSLIEKPDFTDSDAAKMKREIEKFETEKNRESIGRKTGKYEILESFNVEKDSANAHLSNEHWDSIRTIPMLDYEISSYKRSDSLALVKPPKEKKKESPLHKIIFGGNYKSNDREFMEYSGIINIKANFNAVDVFNYGQEITYYKRFKNETTLYLAEEAAYSFGRKQVLWDTKLLYGYYPEARAVLYINYGNETVDFNETGGINITSNSLSSLFFKKNYINFYGRHFLQAANSIDIADGWRLTVGVSYQKQKQLENNTNFSIFKRSKKYRNNDPVNPYIEQDSTIILSSRSFATNVRLSYTPRQYYMRSGRTKRIVRSDYPTFSLNYKTGITGIFNSVSNFDLLTFEITHKKEIDILNTISYTAKIGKFMKTRRMHFSEFEHFNLAEDDIMFSPFEGLNKMIQTYYSSTNEWFAHINFTYTTSRLILKRVMFERSFMNENIYFSYLHTPYLNHFFETGYGLSNIFRIVGAGIFVGFEDMKYRFIRLKLSIAFGGN
ncbi:MAG: DUF5686 and carboxypeptidase regulatory-like domain-containing protein [Prevotellaceae bacterium]|jgi:hypothetical protein|nr:DUF5686 and carboxypeptidase regulatory-like domain-containing protein [Prevotellaceae bacterium]